MHQSAGFAADGVIGGYEQSVKKHTFCSLGGGCCLGVALPVLDSNFAESSVEGFPYLNAPSTHNT